MALLDSLLVFAILGVMAILVYLKMTKKTLLDFIREIREAFKDKQEEVINV